MTHLLKDHAELRRRLDQLTERRNSLGINARTLEAQIECFFRLAVHPQTPPQEALELLRKAAALDPANAKHSYHIARLYFIHGEFDLAAEWLRVAAVRCPTSHRIWAHVALLQRELCARYKLNDSYDGEALLKFGVEITERIKGGKDEFGGGLLTFVPPPSRKALEAARHGGDVQPPAVAETEPFPEWVERLTDPGTCRWSGVADLRMEIAFQGEANKATLQELLPSLESAGRGAAAKPDRLSAFAVLAIQWMLAGFPPGSVRRLCPVALPPADPSPELVLLDLAVRAFEAPPAEVPTLLAEGLDRGRIPPTLAAVIHHRRLIAWRPLAFGSAAKVGEVRQFLASQNGGPGVAGSDKLNTALRKHRDALAAAREALRIGPKSPLEDASPALAAGAARIDVASARYQLDCLRNDAARLKEAKNQLVAHILERVEAPLKAALDPAAGASAAGDRPAVERIRDEVKQAAATGQAKLDKLKRRTADLPGAELGPGFVSGCETCERDLRDARNVGNIAGMLKRVDARAEAIRMQFGLEPGPVSAECRSMSAIVTSLFKSDALSAAELSAGVLSESQAPASLAEQVAALDKRAKELRVQVNTELELLAALEKAHKDGQLGRDGLDNLPMVAAFAEKFPTECDAGIKEADAIRNSGELTSTDSIQQLEATVRNFRAVQPFKKTFRDRLKKFSDRWPETVPGSAVGEPTTSDHAAPQIAMIATPVERAPVDALQADLAATESELSAFYAKCLAEFDAYSQRSRSEPALAELIATIRRFEADALYRSGRRRSARAIWNGLLQQHRLDPDLMHKLAVADTHQLDPGIGLASWKGYTEVLYFLDVLAGTPRPSARRRAELHHHLSGAYGPPGLILTRDQQLDSQPDIESVIGFLNDPARVRNFVAHKLLEFASIRFDYTSPAILLGVSRGDGASSRKAARETWGKFVEHVAPYFPARIRGAFVGTAQRHLDAALRACESASRLVRCNDPRYDDEQRRHVRWLAEVISMKSQLRNLVYESVNQLASSVTSICFLDELVKLDSVPLNTNPDWMVDAARSVFKPENLSQAVNELPCWFAPIRDNVLLPLLGNVFKGPDAETVNRETLYQRLVGPWLRHEAIWKQSPEAGDRTYADLLDDPSPFYPEAVHKDLTSDPPGGRAVVVLREWCRRYPQSTGPARHLASLLIKSEKMDEAAAVLDAAISAAFHDKGRAESQSLKRHVTLAKALKRAKVGNLEAADELLESLRAEDGDPHLAEQVINGFVILAQAANKDPGAERLAVAVENWAAAARSKIAANESREVMDSRVAAINDVRTNRDKALVMIALATGGGHTKSPDWNRIITEMTALLGRNPNLNEPYYFRMIAYWQMAVAASKRKAVPEVRSHASSARYDASRVVAAFPDTDKAEEAGRILQQTQDMD